MKEMNKRGQQMTLGTIIAIVLGIAVLVFLIFGFATGWNNMWSKVTGYTSEANVKDRITDCDTDCSLGETSAYCNEKKTLKFFDGDGKIVKIEGTCSSFSSDDFEDEDIDKGQIAGMGFDGCSTITCA